MEPRWNETRVTRYLSRGKIGFSVYVVQMNAKVTRYNMGEDVDALYEMPTKRFQSLYSLR